MEGGGWYMNTPQGPTGPLTEQQLKEYAESGHVLATTHVWREGLPQWDEVAAIPVLRGVMAAATAHERRTKAAAAATTTTTAAAAQGGTSDPPGPGAGGAPDELEFEDDDGTVYEWDHAHGKYRPKEDPAAKAIAERAAAQARAAAAAAEVAVSAAAAAAAAAGPSKPATSTAALPAYDPAEMTYVPPGEEAAKGPGAKRRADGESGGQQNNNSSTKRAKAQQPAAKAPNPPAAAPQQQLSTTSVYVTGLPEDATEAEIAAAFSRCGVIRLDARGRPRVRLYADRETGAPKGDALVCYLKPPSVALAVQLLDGAPLRPGKSDLPMSVSVARFDAAAADEAAAAAAGDGTKAAASGSSVAGVSSAAAARQRRKERERQERRLLGWDGYDDAAPARRATVVLAPMFSRDEVRAPGGAGRDLPRVVERDVSEECARRGLRLVRCVAFSGHPRGVVTARFATAEDADACVAAMHGRFYGGRRVEAALWDGLTNYRAEEEREEEGEGEEGDEERGEGRSRQRRRRRRSDSAEASSSSQEDQENGQEEDDERGKAPGRKGGAKGGGSGAPEEEDGKEDEDDDDDARLASFFGGDDG